MNMIVDYNSKSFAFDNAVIYLLSYLKLWNKFITTNFSYPFFISLIWKCPIKLTWDKNIVFICIVYIFYFHNAAFRFIVRVPIRLSGILLIFLFIINFIMYILILYDKKYNVFFQRWKYGPGMFCIKVSYRRNYIRIVQNRFNHHATTKMCIKAAPYLH